MSDETSAVAEKRSHEDTEVAAEKKSGRRLTVPRAPESAPPSRGAALSLLWWAEERPRQESDSDE